MTQVKTQWTPAQEAEKMALIGATLANEWVKSDTIANKTKRELLTTCAKTHSKNVEGIKHLLDGYANKFLALGYSDSIVRVRKSEANTVFKAYAMTTITNDNQNALEAFDGNYNDFIALARTLIKSDVTKEPKISNRLPKVTEHQEQFIHDKMTSATIYQLTDFIETATKELNKPHDSETARLAERNQLALIVSICKQMAKNDTCEPIVKTCVESIMALVKPVLSKLDIVATESKTDIQELQVAML